MSADCTRDANDRKESNTLFCRDILQISAKVDFFLICSDSIEQTRKKPREIQLALKTVSQNLLKLQKRHRIVIFSWRSNYKFVPSSSETHPGQSPDAMHVFITVSVAASSASTPCSRNHAQTWERNDPKSRLAIESLNLAARFGKESQESKDSNHF